MSEEKSTIYIKACEVSPGCFSISVESLLIIYVYKLCESKYVHLKLHLIKSPLDISVKLSNSQVIYSVIDNSDLPHISTYCMWPIITVRNNVIAGVSAVARQIIKQSQKPNVQHLLGFRGNCLMACSEVSVWTMFCEIDMPQTIKRLIENLNDSKTIEIPNCMSRFEFHLKQPVRIHNMYKVARIENNKKISSDTPKTELNLEHKYAEGPTMMISDIILYPCVDLFFKLFVNYNLHEKFPVIHKWYKNMQHESGNLFDLILPSVSSSLNISIDDNFVKQSLYKSDMSHYKMEKKTYTKQTNIERALEIISSSNIRVLNSKLLYGSEVDFDWESIPTELNPCGGSLPEKRADRKCEQLESMVKPALKIVGKSHITIVDFCSGSGHLGLLLAYLLPKCHVILVENKEKSLSRATERIEILNLQNVTIVQSNLDYFSADFQLGVSLHACGTATDLVMQMCVKKQASFVCCPCCYGGIKKCHLVDYPRSRSFSSLMQLTYKDYMSVAHGADQTHDSENAKTGQGYKCMDVIDTDRKLYAENFGYRVHLGKLQPVTCTNKNNVIVGIVIT